VLNELVAPILSIQNSEKLARFSNLPANLVVKYLWYDSKVLVKPKSHHETTTSVAYEFVYFDPQTGSSNNFLCILDINTISDFW